MPVILTIDYSREPEDNGDRINIGCYGNTTPSIQEKKCLPDDGGYKNFPNNKWVMIGVPIAPNEGNPPGDPFAIFGDDFGGQMPNGTNWTLHSLGNGRLGYGVFMNMATATIYQPPYSLSRTWLFRHGKIPALRLMWTSEVVRLIIVS
jgi:hypothetical protein